jgi:serine/threonine-protein kinase
MSLVTLSKGSLFAGRYRVGRCIATGGMGAVYVATHIETERRCALKVMLPHIVSSSELRKRFRQEAKVAAQIESDFIVDVLDAGIDEATGLPFLVMELLIGEDLGAKIDRDGRLLQAQALVYLRQLALALDRTHKKSIVHRDLKPENLFLSRRDDGALQLKVLDFGIAKIVAEGGGTANVTRSVGTPLYMAPEQFKPDGRVTPQTDIYALGLIAYTMIVGKAYWEDEKDKTPNVFGFAALASSGPVEAASIRAERAGARIPRAFNRWFAKATALAPNERYQRATDAVRAFADVFGLDAGLPLSSAPDPGPPVASASAQPANVTDSSLAITRRRVTGRPRAWAMLGASAAALGLTLIVWRALRTPHDSQGTSQALSSAGAPVAATSDPASLPIDPNPRAPAPPAREPSTTQRAPPAPALGSKLPDLSKKTPKRGAPAAPPKAAAQAPKPPASSASKSAPTAPAQPSERNPYLSMPSATPR